jgi:hypothetical protein
VDVKVEDAQGDIIVAMIKTLGALHSKYAGAVNNQCHCQVCQSVKSYVRTKITARRLEKIYDRMEIPQVISACDVLGKITRDPTSEERWSRIQSMKADTAVKRECARKIKGDVDPLEHIPHSLPWCFIIKKKTRNRLYDRHLDKSICVRNRCTLMYCYSISD